MHAGEVHAWHHVRKQPVRIRWTDGVIEAVEPGSADAAVGVWIAPALFDLQVNGFAGVDFQRDGLSMEELLLATDRLAAAGCSRFLLTLIADDWAALKARLRYLRSLREQSVKLRHAIAGWHIEGPFLSGEPGFHGAHEPALMLDPAPELIRELRAITDSDPLLLTLAPERSGALEAITLAVSLGAKVSLGHTDATGETLRRAVAAGASGFTHLGNACPQQLDRHDNILWRVLDGSGLTVSLIPDRIHVAPPLFRLVHRALPMESICYVTDAVAAADAPPGRYTIGRLEVEVGPDQVVRPPGRSNYAGSALRPIDGVCRAAEMLGCSCRQVWDGFSIRPARFMGLEASIEPGAPADFCLLTLAENGGLSGLRTFVRGAQVA